MISVCENPLAAGVLLYPEAAKAISIARDLLKEKCGVVLTHSSARGNEIRYAEASKHLGGLGVTDRNEEQFKMNMHGTHERLMKERGQIAFFGNGLSSVPLRHAMRFKTGELHKPPIVVDALDYGLLADSFQDLGNICSQHGWQFPFQPQLLALQALLRQQREGFLVIVQHTFGSGKESPKCLQDSSLAVNAFGPPKSTLPEQVALLANGGELHYRNIEGAKSIFRIASSTGADVQMSRSPNAPLIIKKRN
jgi:hypothetical protein